MDRPRSAFPGARRRPSRLVAARRPWLGPHAPALFGRIGVASVGVAIGCGFTIAVAACTTPGPSPAVTRHTLPTASIAPAPAFAADVQNGMRIFAAHCARCHGPQGAGDGPLASSLSPRPADWTLPGALRDRSPSRLFAAVRRGVLGSSMKRFDTVLDEPSTWDVVFYIFLRPSDVRSRTEPHAAYGRTCAGCHGPSGAALSSRSPSLARPDWVAMSRDALAERVAGAHPAGVAHGTESESRAASERIWDWLIAPQP